MQLGQATTVTLDNVSFGITTRLEKGSPLTHEEMDRNIKMLKLLALFPVVSETGNINELFAIINAPEFNAGDDPVVVTSDMLYGGEAYAVKIIGDVGVFAAPINGGSAPQSAFYDFGDEKYFVIFGEGEIRDLSQAQLG